MKYFLSHYIAPILWKVLLRSQRYEFLRQYNSIEYQGLETNISKQRAKLYHVVQYAIDNIPYYQKIASDKNIVPSLETIESDLATFPVLTKDIIRKEWSQLVNPKVPAIKNTSGGTTGVPIEFLQDRCSRDWGAAAKMFFYRWAGRKDGESMISLWGSERDTLEGTQGFRGWLVRFFTNTEILNTFRMTKQDMTQFLKHIRKMKPVLVLAYVQSICELARFAAAENISVNMPRIMTSAGNLYPHFRTLLKQTFGARVFDRYGSREVGDMACSCEKEDGLHLNVLNHYFEVLDEQMRPVAPEESGQVHITTLNNFAMPLLRYQIGDRATGIDKERLCPCGRGLPRIQRVIGRDVGLFWLSDGTMVDGEFFTHLFYHRKWVKQFQVIQEDFHCVRLLVVLAEETSPCQDRVEIEEAICKVMGRDCAVIWEYLNEIQPSQSGKFQYTISRVLQG